jgi:hypothetical protein
VARKPTAEPCMFCGEQKCVCGKPTKAVGTASVRQPGKNRGDQDGLIGPDKMLIIPPVTEAVPAPPKPSHLAAMKQQFVPPVIVEPEPDDSLEMKLALMCLAPILHKQELVKHNLTLPLVPVEQRASRWKEKRNASTQESSES